MSITRNILRVKYNTVVTYSTNVLFEPMLVISYAITVEALLFDLNQFVFVISLALFSFLCSAMAICKYYLEGRCRYGNSCRFEHRQGDQPVSAFGGGGK
jgi:hypothetical protein